MAELSPAQLDLLEDALEDLERSGTAESLLGDDPDGVLRERVSSYRTIVSLAREAMPMQDVPAGLLDDVLAEARTAAATPVAAAAKPSWWARLRKGLLVPAVALAGTAALVLWIGQPESVEVGPAAPAPSSASAANKAEPAPAGAPGEAAAAPAQDRGGASLAEKAADEYDNEEEEVPGTVAAEPAPAPIQAAEDAKAARTRALEADKPQEPASEVIETYGRVPKTDGKDSPESGRWDLITSADAARQAGDCIGARADYAIALEDDLAEVRARATAGIGLCEMQAGNRAAADAHFERARQLDATISGFIDSQTQPSKPRSKGKRKKKSAPTASPKANSKSDKPQLNQMDPFG